MTGLTRGDAAIKDSGLANTIAPQLPTRGPPNSPTFAGTVAGITKAMVGLGSADNTRDASKPVSTATQTALDLKANSSAVYTKGQVDQFCTRVYKLPNQGDVNQWLRFGQYVDAVP